MNKDQIIGNWRQFKGEAQKRWGRLTNDQLDQIEGSREKLAGALQETYGIALEQATKQVSEWESQVNKNNDRSTAA